MIGLLKRYVRWLHTGWPAGTVEKLPLVGEDGSTNVAGLYVVGDLTGIPLLKFSADTGARAVQISAGGDHNCARLEDGRVRCWGIKGTTPVEAMRRPNHCP